MKMNLLVGNDVGNSDQKVYINDTYIKQPSCYSKVSQSLNLDEVNPEAVQNDIFNNVMVTINSPSCQSGTYYIGNKALKSGLAVYNMDIIEKKNQSEVYYINTLAMISAYAVKNADINNSDAINITVDMACSLPVNQYSKSEGKIVKDKLEGNHNVTVHLGKKRIDTFITFNYIKVLPESVSIMFALREMEGKEYDTKKILHVAIGEGTTEYPLTEGIRFNPDFIMGSNNGIGHAIEKALNPFQSHFGLRTYSRQDYSHLIQTNEKYTEVAKDFLQEPLNVEAQDILRYVKNEVQKAKGDIDMLVVHGGGSILMKKHLEKKLKEFCQQKLIDLFFVNDSHAVSLEAQGLYSFAQSEIFNTLKQKAEGKV
jgi:plasmid segregation protein ParM